jgi:hypothetical protein
MRSTALALLGLVFAGSVQAATLTVACGKNGFDAIEKNKPALADVYVTASLRGATNPPANVSAKFNGIAELTDKNSFVIYKADGDGTKTLEVKRKGLPYDSVKVTVKGCQALEDSSGSAKVDKYTGGFAGTQPYFFDNCNCVVK